MKAMKKTTKKEGGCDSHPPPSPSKFTPCGEGEREGVCKQLGIQTTENISHAFMTPEGSADTREEELSQVGECARNSESVKHGLGKLTDSLDSYGY